MGKNTNFVSELKAFGKEMAQALKEMKSSQEYKQLESDMVKGVKSISASLGKALKAAQKSKSTAKLKKRLGRVVKTGAKEGIVKAEKAQVIAAAKIKQARAAIKDVTAKLKKNKRA